MFKRREHQFTSWLTIVAILLVALVPSVSHAVSAWKGDSDAWQQICTSIADKRIPASNSPETPDQNVPSDQAEHCAYCLLDPASWGPPSQSVQTVSRPDSEISVQSNNALQQPPRVPWTSPHTRAPPAFI